MLLGENTLADVARNRNIDRDALVVANPQIDIGGTGKRGHYGRQEGASSVVTLRLTGGAAMWRLDWLRLGGRTVFQCIRRVGAVGLACELQNDRCLDQAIEESHRQRTVGQVVSPFLEIDVGY